MTEFDRLKTQKDEIVSKKESRANCFRVAIDEEIRWIRGLLLQLKCRPGDGEMVVYAEVPASVLIEKINHLEQM